MIDIVARLLALAGDPSQPDESGAYSVVCDVMRDAAAEIERLHEICTAAHDRLLRGDGDTQRDVFPQAHRLALELECLLLSCTDTAATAKWWDSAHEALEQWREFCREDSTHNELLSGRAPQEGNA